MAAITTENIDFAPYSTTENATGRKWIDGRMIYEKVIKGSINIQANQNIYFNHGITGLTDSFEVISATGSIALGGSATNAIGKSLIPHIEDNNRLGLSLISKTRLRFLSSYPWGQSEFTLVLQYVK